MDVQQNISDKHMVDFDLSFNTNTIKSITNV